MSDGNGEIDKLLARLDAEGHGLEEHPASERLSAYQADELPAEERAAVQAHLESCSLCRERLGDLETFLAPRPEDPTVGSAADFASAAEWRRLREQLSEYRATSVASRTRGRDDRSRLLKSLRLLQSLAAVLGALLVGLSFYTFGSHGNRDALRTIPEQILSFSGTRGLGDSEQIKVRLPVALRVQVDAEYPGYRIEIREPGGRVSFASDDYSSANVDRLILPLPEGSLAPGTYTVELFGLRGGQREPIASQVQLIVQP